MKKLPYLFVIFLVVSCGAKAIVDAGKRPLYEVLIQQSDGGGNIHFYEILTEPNEIKMLQNDELLKDKISALDVQKSNFVILNMGEKNSGGYAVGVESLVETDQNIIINVKESIPESGAMVIEAITYPFCVVKINSKKDIIIK